MRQQTLADGSFEKFRKKTRKELFLDDMEQIIPWQELCGAIEPYYPKPEAAGRRPVGIERMLRIHFLQHWFDLSDPGAEEALYDSRAMRSFVGIDLGREPVPDESTILNFRHLMERHNLGDELFRLVNVYLEENGIKVARGTIVDASIINAPSSTKNKDKKRDPDMHQTRKGKQWCVSRTQASGLWCCTKDGRWPPEAGLQEQASNRPVLLRSKGVVVSDRGKVAHSGWQVCIEKMSESKPTEDASLCPNRCRN